MQDNEKMTKAPKLLLCLAVTLFLNGRMPFVPTKTLLITTNQLNSSQLGVFRW